jgi:hypothetical protein
MKDGSAISFGQNNKGKLGRGELGSDAKLKSPAPKAIAGLGNNVTTCSAGEIDQIGQIRAFSVWPQRSSPLFGGVSDVCLCACGRVYGLSA